MLDSGFWMLAQAPVFSGDKKITENFLYNTINLFYAPFLQIE